MEEQHVRVAHDGTTCARSEASASMRERNLSPPDARERGAMVHRDLLAAVAHDLRSPLNAITLSIASVNEVCVMLADTQAAERMERCVAIAEHAARHMHRMLEQLLDVASVEATGESLQRAPLSLEELIDAGLEMIGGVAESKHVSLRKRVVRGAWVECDRARMLRVLSNLLGNAVKYTPSGGLISVELDTSVEGASVRVIDTGPGVGAEQRSKLFEPYWQARGGGSGVGLGLYIARGIVVAHGGRMWVETEPGRGSAFCFTIPCARTREDL